MKNVVTLEFEYLEDLLAFRECAKLKTYTVDRFKKLSVTCELDNAMLAQAMSYNAIPHFETEDPQGLMLSDILSKSIFKNHYLQKQLYR